MTKEEKVAWIGALGLVLVAVIGGIFTVIKYDNGKSVDPKLYINTNADHNKIESQNGNAINQTASGDIQNNYYSRAETASNAVSRNRLRKTNIKVHSQNEKSVINQSNSVISNNQQGGQTAHEINNYK
jgi:hypothetical protein